MTLASKARSAALAATILVASAAAAFAAPAIVSGNANVRAGAGTNYPVVSHVAYGQSVNVSNCTPSGKWCYVQKSGKDGWVSSQFLTWGQQANWVHHHGWNKWNNNYYGYGYGAGFNACVNGNHASFCLGF